MVIAVEQPQSYRKRGHKIANELAAVCSAGIHWLGMHTKLYLPLAKARLGS